MNTAIYSLIKWYFRKPRNVQFRGLNLILRPSVFHPKLYLTTETFLDFLLTLNLESKSTLELGCGSGAISLYLAKNSGVNAHVSDINQAAVDGVISNADKLSINISSYTSDLFDSIPDHHFDVLIINPPFFANPAHKVDEYAFNAGENYQYFEQLAKQLKSRQQQIGTTYMILTDKCDLQSILSFFTYTDFKVVTVLEKQSLGEKHLIYSISAV